MKKLRGTVVIAASVALVSAGVLASAGAAGTAGIAPGNLAFAGVDSSDGMSDISSPRATEPHVPTSRMTR